MWAERAKQLIRLIEARLTPRRHIVSIDGTPVVFTQSLWWDNATPENFAAEIDPYWSAMSARADARVVVDAGADVGMFALSVAVRRPRARVHAFEPSRRQRVLLRRNLERAGVTDRVTVEAIALWNKTATLPFRTHGAMSAVEPAASHLRGMPFGERVRAEPLDSWANRARPSSVDVIKMDIEGAEIEALEGAQTVLERFRPLVLVQAYHLRDGVRTFERCAACLVALGYRCQELSPPRGLLVGTP